MSFFSDVRRVARYGFDRMVEARERQVRRYVNSALLQFDDETLSRAGLNRKEIERRGGGSNYLF